MRELLNSNQIAIYEAISIFDTFYFDTTYFFWPRFEREMDRQRYA